VLMNLFALANSYNVLYNNDIQGDSGGICNTLGNDSMCDSKQKSSYKHVSDFRRLRSYGHFLIPVHALM
jgi:hypothetical protein